MNATESLLTLLRAARDFTRRAIGAEELERAAIAHAEARGFVSASAAHDIAIEHATLGKNMDAAYQRRIDALEAALRAISDAEKREPQNSRGAVEVALVAARKVLG